MKILMVKYSFQRPMKPVMNNTLIAGNAIGNIILKNTLKWLAPSINAASAYSQEIPLKKEYMIRKFAPDKTSVAVIKIKGEFISPKASYTRYAEGNDPTMGNIIRKITKLYKNFLPGNLYLQRIYVTDASKKREINILPMENQIEFHVIFKKLVSSLIFNFVNAWKKFLSVKCLLHVATLFISIVK